MRSLTQSDLIRNSFRRFDWDGALMKLEVKYIPSLATYIQTPFPMKQSIIYKFTYESMNIRLFLMSIVNFAMIYFVLLNKFIIQLLAEI